VRRPDRGRSRPVVVPTRLRDQPDRILDPGCRASGCRETRAPCRANFPARATIGPTPSPRLSATSPGHDQPVAGPAPGDSRLDDSAGVLRVRDVRSRPPTTSPPPTLPTGHRTASGPARSGARRLRGKPQRRGEGDVPERWRRRCRAGAAGRSGLRVVNISRHCAIQQGSRPIANSTVNIRSGKPIARRRSARCRKSTFG